MSAACAAKAKPSRNGSAARTPGVLPGAPARSAGIYVNLADQPHVRINQGRLSKGKLQQVDHRASGFVFRYDGFLMGSHVTDTHVAFMQFVWPQDDHHLRTQLVR